jgi:hypothetical protein
MATNITINESVTNVSISGGADSTPTYTTITLSNDQGPQGATGSTGAGVPTGGTTGQALVKIDGTNYNTQWTTLSTTPTGSAGGDLTGTYPNPNLATLSPAPTGTYGSASTVPVVTVDSKGRTTSVTPTSISIGSDAVSGLAASATTNTTNASNITSGTLSVSQGGTGRNSLTAGQAVVAQGTGGFTTVAISDAGGASSLVKSASDGSLSTGSIFAGGRFSPKSINANQIIANNGQAKASITYTDITNDSAFQLPVQTTGTPTILTDSSTLDATKLSGTATINTTGTASNVTGTVGVANGGTGQTTLASGEVVIGAGTSGVTTTAVTTTGAAGAIVKTGSGGLIVAGSSGITSTGGAVVTGAGILVASSASSPPAAGTLQATTVSAGTGGVSSTGAITSGNSSGSNAGSVKIFSSSAGNLGTILQAAGTTSGVSNTLTLPTTAGTLALTSDNISGTSTGISGSQTANTVLAAPNGSSGTATFRTLVAADIPASLSSTTSVNGTMIPASGGTLVGQATTDILTNKSISGSTNTLTNIPGANITAATIPQSAMVNTKTLNRLTSSITSSTTVGTYTNIFSTGSYTMTADTTYAVKMFVLYQRSVSTSVANTLQVKFTLSNTQQSVALGNITEAGASISSASIGYYSSGTSVLVGTATSTNGNPFIGIIEGFIRTNATTGGTITPQFTISAGNGTTDTINLLAGTYVELTNLGTGAPALPYGSTGWT